MSEQRYAGDLSPKDAWDLLAHDERAALVDVRTAAEWSYVGIPDLSRLEKKLIMIPWQLFPSMQVNPTFADDLQAQGITPDAPLLFICRSGKRSQSAAIAMTARGYPHCYNVASGFEGDPDMRKHRGTVNGWKFDELPWIQE